MDATVKALRDSVRDWDNCVGFVHVQQAIVACRAASVQRLAACTHVKPKPTLAMRWRARALLAWL